MYSFEREFWRNKFYMATEILRLCDLSNLTTEEAEEYIKDVEEKIKQEPFEIKEKFNMSTRLNFVDVRRFENILWWKLIFSRYMGKKLRKKCQN